MANKVFEIAEKPNMPRLSIKFTPSGRLLLSICLGIGLGLSLTLWLASGCSPLNGPTNLAGDKSTPQAYVNQAEELTLEPTNLAGDRSTPQGIKCGDVLTVTNAADNGPGSLRQAIHDMCDGGRITFAADYTIHLNSTLEIDKWLTIDGEAHAVALSGDSLGDGTPDVRVFYIERSGVVTLTHLSIVSGTAGDGDGGGISNLGTLSVQNSTLSGNKAYAYGGGIDNRGTLVVQNSIFSNNSIRYNGGGIHNWGVLAVQDSTFTGNKAFVGGGIENNDDGTVIVQDSTFSGNWTTNGAGICNEEGTLIVQNSAFSDNSAMWGGGIENHGSLTVTNSTLANNEGSLEGGGIENYGVVVIQNSTLSGNSADWGGGINNRRGALTVANCTLADNRASLEGGGISNGATLHLYNTLIVHSPSGGDCMGNVATNDHNLMQSTLITNTCGVADGAGGSIIGVDPLLGPLADNGAPSTGSGQAILTFALLPGSPAIDAGNNATCLATDQRSIARPQGAACDIGAFEVQGK
jgi:hypothetical protein